MVRGQKQVCGPKIGLKFRAAIMISVDVGEGVGQRGVPGAQGAPRPLHLDLHRRPRPGGGAAPHSRPRWPTGRCAVTNGARSAGRTRGGGPGEGQGTGTGTWLGSPLDQRAHITRTVNVGAVTVDTNVSVSTGNRNHTWRLVGGGGVWHKALGVGSVSLWRRLLASRL